MRIRFDEGVWRPEPFTGEIERVNQLVYMLEGFGAIPLTVTSFKEKGLTVIYVETTANFPDWETLTEYCRFIILKHKKGEY